MNIKDIYSKFGIPPNLQDHMVRVCTVVIILENHWIGHDKINWDELKVIALLHDLGNIVKFDFDKHPEFLGDEVKNIDHWKAMQKKVRDQYGIDDHEATKSMLNEIGVKQDIITTILNKSFGNSIKIKNTNNWQAKILLYADLRILPWGVGSLDDRMTDVKSRMPQYTSRPDFEDLVSSCYTIETQIQKNIDISTSKISELFKVSNIEELLALPL